MPNFFFTPAEVAADDPLHRTAAEFARWYGPPLTEEMIQAAEATLGVKLPGALIELFRESNGGFLNRRHFSAYGLEIEMRQVGGIGWEDGLDSDSGSLYMRGEWGYPEGLLWIEGDGHTGIFLDYRTCGPQGEPSVVWYDTEEADPQPQQLAPTFADFLTQLRTESDGKA